MFYELHRHVYSFLMESVLDHTSSAPVYCAILLEYDTDKQFKQHCDEVQSSTLLMPYVLRLRI